MKVVDSLFEAVALAFPWDRKSVLIGSVGYHSGFWRCGDVAMW
jgi:hypothetical protein